MLKKTSRLDVLLGRAAEEMLSPEEATELEEILTRDPDARKRYLHYLDLHAELEESFQLHAVAGGLGSVFFPGVSGWRLWTGAAACAACGMLFASVAWAYATPLIQKAQRRTIFTENFEDRLAHQPTGLPRAPGAWSGDDASVVGAENGVHPKTGNSMLRFLRSTHAEENTPKSAWCDIYRLVELSTPPGLGSRLSLSASFAVAPASDGEQFDIYVGLNALDTYPVQAPDLDTARNLSNTTLGRRLPVTRDGKWHELSVDTQVSPQTRYVLVHLAMLRRVPGPSPSHVRFAGHYLDDIKLDLLPSNALPVKTP
jgi:hypothetical protein